MKIKKSRIGPFSSVLKNISIYLLKNEEGAFDTQSCRETEGDFWKNI